MVDSSFLMHIFVYFVCWSMCCMVFCSTSMFFRPNFSDVFGSNSQRSEPVAVVNDRVSEAALGPTPKCPGVLQCEATILWLLNLVNDDKPLDLVYPILGHSHVGWQVSVYVGSTVGCGGCFPYSKY